MPVIHNRIITNKSMRPSIPCVWRSAPHLPFRGQARKVVGIAAQNEIKNSLNTGVSTMPYVVKNLGTEGTEIKLHWTETVKGKVQVTVRADNPV